MGAWTKTNDLRDHPFATNAAGILIDRHPSLDRIEDGKDADDRRETCLDIKVDGIRIRWKEYRDFCHGIEEGLPIPPHLQNHFHD